MGGSLDKDTYNKKDDNYSLIDYKYDLIKRKYNNLYNEFKSSIDPNNDPLQKRFVKHKIIESSENDSTSVKDDNLYKNLKYKYSNNILSNKDITTNNFNNCFNDLQNNKFENNLNEKILSSNNLSDKYLLDQKYTKLFLGDYYFELNIRKNLSIKHIDSLFKKNQCSIVLYLENIFDYNKLFKSINNKNCLNYNTNIKDTLKSNKDLNSNDKYSIFRFNNKQLFNKEEKHYLIQNIKQKENYFIKTNLNKHFIINNKINSNLLHKESMQTLENIYNNINVQNSILSNIVLSKCKNNMKEYLTSIGYNINLKSNNNSYEYISEILLNDYNNKISLNECQERTPFSYYLYGSEYLTEECINILKISNDLFIEKNKNLHKLKDMFYDDFQSTYNNFMLNYVNRNFSICYKIRLELFFIEYYNNIIFNKLGYFVSNSKNISYYNINQDLNELIVDYIYSVTFIQKSIKRKNICNLLNYILNNKLNINVAHKSDFDREIYIIFYLENIVELEVFDINKNYYNLYLKNKQSQ